MRFDFFPIPFLLGLALLLLVLPFVWLKKRSLRFLVIFSIFWFYLLLVFGVTIFPVFEPLNGESRRSVDEILARINLTPFHNLRFFRLRWFVRSEMFANILMMIPFGLLLPLLIRIRAYLFPLLAVLPGAGIELTQLAISLVTGRTTRITDITDVILNFSGAMVGYIIYLCFAWLGNRKPKKLNREFRDRANIA